MKKILFLLSFLLPALAPAQTQFWSDTFEDVGAPSSGARTPSVTFNASNERYFDRVTTAQVNTTNVYSGFEGVKFWGGADIDNITGQNTQSPHQNVTWSSINISGRGALSFKGTFAIGNSANFDHFPGSSPIDYMIVEYRIDGGPWTSIVRFFPNIANSGAGALALETTGDSLAAGEGAALNGTFTEFTANIPGSGTLLDIRFKCEANGTSFEEVAADNFRLFETAACSNPTITTQPANSNVCIGASTTFTIAATGALTYQWQVNTGSGFVNATNVAPYSGVTSQTLTITGATAGMNGYLYRCIATNGACNTTSSAATLTVSNPSLTPNSQLNVSCFGGANGSATVSPAAGGIAPYTYNWTPGNPTGDGTISVTGLIAGSWTCTTTDNIGCTATATFNITQPTAISVTPASQTNVSCFGGSNGAASINTPTGGAGGYTYNWTPGNPSGDGTVAVNGLTAGSWTCTVTDANSCTRTQTFNITQPTAIVITPASQTNTSCFGGSNGAASINTPTGGAGGYSYNWTPGNPTGDGTVAVTGLTAGSWTCTVTDANSCTATQTFNITQPTAIVVTPATQTNISCFGGSNGAASINTPTGGAGGYTYNWTPGNPTGDGTVAVTGLTAGSWTCTVTDANSCTATQTFNITQPPVLVASAASQTNISCFGGSNGAASVFVSGGTVSYSYNWTPGNPTGDGTASVTGLTVGSWTCTVTDANSCTATQTFNITQPTAIVVTPASLTNISCFGGSNGAASINTPTGGAGGYTYNWTPGNPTGDGTVSVTGLTAGSWTCTVTDANSCTATQTFNITQPTAIVVTPASQTNIACNGGSNGAASINTPTGGAGGYTYNWTPGNPTGDGTVSVIGLTAGTWTCTVTDANSCTATQTFNITQPTAITASISSTPTSCTANTGTATVSAVSGGAGTYTYSWAPTGGTSTTATALAANTYTCTITDVNGCSITRTVTVTTASGPSLTAASQTNISCFGGSNGAASVNAATGGTSPYTYNWTPGNPTGDGTVSVTGLTAGTWTCTVTDANGCTAFVTFNITQPPALVVSAASQTNISCNGGTNGAASVTVSGGTVAYSYNWTPGNPTGDGTASVTGLAAGTWTCTVTDANSCTATQTFNITQPTALVVSPVSQTNISCNGGVNGAASVTVSGGTVAYSYNWTPGNPTGDGTASVTGLTAGSWTCTVTDANSCTATQTFNITQPAALVVSPVSQTNISCNGGTNGAASVTVSGGTVAYNYNWTPGNPTGDGTASVTGLAAGTWTCTVTDANSCVSTQTFNITQPTALVVNALSQTNVSCFGGANGAASVTATGGTVAYSYNWTPGNPTGDGTASVTGLTAGTWTCTVTDANGCVSTRTFNITQPPALVVSPVSQTNISCNGGANGAASVTVSGGTLAYSYNWTPGNPTGDGTASVTGLTAGTWTCTVTDANSCTATQTFNITQPNALVVSPVSQTNIACNGGSNGAASVTVTGGTLAYSYNWTPGNPTGDGTASVTGLTAGTWTCTVTDANSCSATQTFNITQPTAITASIASTPTSCTANTGTATVSSVTGGAGTYTYLWAPTGGTAPTATGLAANTYTCTITDANGCSITRTVTVTTATGPTLTAAAQTSVSCFGGSNGTASVNPATGGTAPYTYNWTPGNPTGDGTTSVTGLSAGTWTCTVTDANGCTASATFNITQPPLLSVAVVLTTHVSCFGSCNGAITVNATGGTPGYTYNWAPISSTSPSVSGLCAGTYTCTVTDTRSCNAVIVISITQPTALVASSSSQTNVSCFGGSNGAASVSVSGGATPYSYNWTPGNPTGDGTSSVTGLTAGTWTCTVTDANGCLTTRTFNITQPPALVLTASATPSTICAGNSTTATASSTGGTGTVTYVWQPGNLTGATQTLSPTTTTTYTVTATDANGCQTTQTLTITVNPRPIVVLSGTSTFCAGGSTLLTGSSGGTSQWYRNGVLIVGANSNTYTATTAGVYNMTKTNTNGCFDSAAVGITVIVNPLPVVSNTSSVSPLCNGNSNGSATVVATGVGTLTYAWSPTGGNASTATGLGVGTYSCLITDANGCTQTATVNITEPAVLTTTATSSVPAVCLGDSLQLNANAAGGTGTLTYTWMPGNLTGAPMVAPSASTTYTLTATDANACSATATVNVTVNALPVVNLGNDITQCGNAIITLDALNTGSSYLWNDNTTNQTLDVVASGSYSVLVTDSNGCSSSDSIQISIGQLPVIGFVDQVSCAPIVLDAGNVGSTYVWNDNSTNQTFAVNNSGMYFVTVTDSFGCTSSDTVNVTINTPPVVDLGVDTTQCGGSILLDAGNAGSAYIWNDSTTNQTLTATTTGNYYVTVTDSNGCSTTDSVLLTINVQPVVSFTLSSDTICIADAVLTLSASPAGGIFNGSGVLGNTFSANVAGQGMQVISYVFIDSTGCSDTGIDSIYVDQCLSINEYNSLNLVNLYPNPNNGQFAIQTAHAGVVEVFNNLGELVWTQNVQLGTTEMMNASLANGLYLVRFTNEQKEVQQIKMLIQR